MALMRCSRFRAQLVTPEFLALTVSTRQSCTHSGTSAFGSFVGHAQVSLALSLLAGNWFGGVSGVVAERSWLQVVTSLAKILLLRVAPIRQVRLPLQFACQQRLLGV